MGPLSDKLGRKPLILVGLYGGAFGYFLMFCAAQASNYWYFVGAMAVNGLFSGTKSVMFSYLADTAATLAEFQKRQPIMGTFMLMGGSGGGLVRAALAHAHTQQLDMSTLSVGSYSYSLSCASGVLDRWSRSHR
jgi:MFS family permease